MPRLLPPLAALALVALFLAGVARFYHPGVGFTEFIGLPAGEQDRFPVLREIPHVDRPLSATYDGQFYAQLALEPLLRDPTIDLAMDLPPYRARRILFSWTAYALGLGRPAWVLHAYAVQNILCWLVLAALLTRWIPPLSFRGLALWAACMFAHGLLWSVRAALLDGPSLLLIACAIVAAERGAVLTSAAIVGVSGLGRETNLLATAALRTPAGRHVWIRVLVAALLVVLPLLVWQDYLWSIYRSTSVTRQNQLSAPLLVFAREWIDTLADARASGFFSPAGSAFCAIASLTAQGMYLIRRREYASPWWRVAACYAVLVLLVDKVVWDGYPGAITRVALPLTVGFNVLLARERGPWMWPWFVAGNLHLLPGTQVLPVW